MLLFNLASTDPAAFHLILCFAANDIAARSGRLDSEDAITHRIAALSLVKKNVLDYKRSDDFIAAVTTLAGHKVCSPLQLNVGISTFITKTGNRLFSDPRDKSTVIRLYFAVRVPII
jgi:hypothetical protein